MGPTHSGHEPVSLLGMPTSGMADATHGRQITAPAAKTVAFDVVEGISDVFGGGSVNVVCNIYIYIYI